MAGNLNLSFSNLADFPATGNPSKIYLAKDSNTTYKWVNAGYEEFGQKTFYTKKQVAYFGDSMTRQNYFVGPTTKLIQDVGYFTWANAYLGQQMELVNPDAGGVNGDTTTLMLDRIQSSVIDFKPQWCFVLCGFNDINNGVNIDTILTNLKTIYDTLLANNIRVITLSVLPSTSFNAVKTDSLNRVNNFINNYAYRTANMTFIDTFTAMVDVTSSTGAPLSGMLGDGIHPATKGAQILGRTIYNALKSEFGYTPFIQSRTDAFSATNLTGNLSGNPVMYGTGVASGSGVSGNIATNWNVLLTGGTAVLSKVARTDFPNLEYQNVVFSNSSGFGQGCYIHSTQYNISAVPAGSYAYFAVEVNLTNITTNTVSQMYAKIVNNESTAKSAVALGNSGGQLITETGNFILKTPAIPVGLATTLSYQVYVEINTGAGSVTFQVGRSELRII